MPRIELTESEVVASVEAARRALSEDLALTYAGPSAETASWSAPTSTDITTSPLLSLATESVRGAFVARQPGVVAGTASAGAVFDALEPRSDVSWEVGDGDVVEAGETLGTVSGLAVSVLAGERSALNLLCHLSGIASLTARYVAAISEYAPRCSIRDTRKTTSGLRVVEKAAVRAGGGVNHRIGLFDGVLIKDNHLLALPHVAATLGRSDARGATGGVEPAAFAAALTEAISQIRDAHPEVEVEVEADTLEEVEGAISAGADVVLCDNMPVGLLREAVGIARGRVKIEASGGVNLENVAEIASAGVDFIAVGALTHSAPALDIGLDFEPSS